MVFNSCPSGEDLKFYLRSNTIETEGDSELFRKTEQHLNHCPECQNRIYQYSSSCKKEFLTKVPGYRLLRKIGENDFGEVYQGVKPSINRKVIVKALNPSIRGMAQPERFKESAIALGKLDHPNVTKVYDFYIPADQKKYFLMMQFIKGERLENYIRFQRPINLEEIIPLWVQMVEAVEAFHEAGLLHRNLRPSNFLIDEKNNIKLIDFSLMKAAKLNGKSSLDAHLMLPPYYISPEVCRGELETIQSDIYSLGSVFYFILTGIPPFGGKNIPEILSNIMQHRLEPISSIVPDIPSEFQEILEKMMAKFTEYRYRHCTELLEELLQVCLKKGISIKNQTRRFQRSFDLSTQNQTSIDQTMTLSPDFSLFQPYASTKDEEQKSKEETKRIKTKPVFPSNPKYVQETPTSNVSMNIIPRKDEPTTKRIANPAATLKTPKTEQKTKQYSQKFERKDPYFALSEVPTGKIVPPSPFLEDSTNEIMQQNSLLPRRKQEIVTTKIKRVESYEKPPAKLLNPLFSEARRKPITSRLKPFHLKEISEIDSSRSQTLKHCERCDEPRIQYQFFQCISCFKNLCLLHREELLYCEECFEALQRNNFFYQNLCNKLYKAQSEANSVEFSGKVTPLALARIFNHLSLDEKSNGLLVFGDGNEKRGLCFLEKNLFLLDFGGKIQTKLGDIFLESETITREKLKEALEFQKSHTALLGEILVSLRAIGPDLLEEGLIGQFSKEILTTSRWKNNFYKFKPGKPPEFMLKSITKNHKLELKEPFHFNLALTNIFEHLNHILTPGIFWLKSSQGSIGLLVNENKLEFVQFKSYSDFSFEEQILIDRKMKLEQLNDAREEAGSQPLEEFLLEKGILSKTEIENCKQNYFGRELVTFLMDPQYQCQFLEGEFVADDLGKPFSLEINLQDLLYRIFERIDTIIPLFTFSEIFTLVFDQGSFMDMYKILKKRMYKLLDVLKIRSEFSEFETAFLVLVLTKSFSLNYLKGISQIKKALFEEKNESLPEQHQMWLNSLFVEICRLKKEFDLDITKFKQNGF